MQSKMYRQQDMIFVDHPRFANVRMAALVTSLDTSVASVCCLDIAPGTEIPVHTHDPQVDSIFVVAGQGEAYINGAWQQIAAGTYIFVPKKDEHGIRNTGDVDLQLFVHHSPPLL